MSLIFHYSIILAPWLCISGNFMTNPFSKTLDKCTCWSEFTLLMLDCGPFEKNGADESSRISSMLDTFRANGFIFDESMENIFQPLWSGCLQSFNHLHPSFKQLHGFPFPSVGASSGDWSNASQTAGGKMLWKHCSRQQGNAGFPFWTDYFKKWRKN